MRVSSSAQGPSLGELGQASWPGGTAPFERGHAPRRMGLAPSDREASFWGGWSSSLVSFLPKMLFLVDVF